MKCSCNKKKEKWPKRFVKYIHCEKDQNWADGEELGLSDKAISANFAYLCYEIGLDVEVNKDGTFKILGIHREEDK